VVRRVLAAGGVIELRNAVRTLRRGDGTLHLCGVDSVLEGIGRLDRVLEGLPEGGAAVLLAHEPDFADTSAETERFDLQLSGHSHGGQVSLPLLRSAVLPRLSRKYPSGLYRVGGMLLYTNRGLGTHPRFRLGCRPEITVFTLRAPDERPMLR
jgi:predicted MPP superfamily phosphohydrolase